MRWRRALLRRCSSAISTSCWTLRLPALHSSQRRGHRRTLKSQGVTRQIDAAKAVILAGGGFTRNPAQRRRDAGASRCLRIPPAAPGATGELQDLALKLGARFGEGNLDNAFWSPVSLRQTPGRLDRGVSAFHSRPLQTRHASASTKAASASSTKRPTIICSRARCSRPTSAAQHSGLSDCRRGGA